MANSWCRLYAEIAHDAKVQMMSETMQRRWFMLLCLRCSNDNGTFQDEEMAFLLRVSSDEVQATKTLFQAKGLIEKDWFIPNWDKRQFASDSSTERVRKHREKLEQELEQKKRSSNAPEQNRTEAETEQKQSKALKTLTADAVNANPPKRRSKADRETERRRELAAWEANDFPPGIPRDEWEGFKIMREEIGHGLTVTNAISATRTLARLESEGHSPALVLERSILGRYRGLFGSPDTKLPPKPKPRMIFEEVPAEQWLGGGDSLV